MNELRRSKRKMVDQTIQVTDAMTGAVMGRIGNLSIDGMMLIANQELRENALFQVLFHLRDDHGHAVPVEVGMHEQWSEPGAAPGQYWAGFRIIDIAPRDFEVLKKWIEDDATH
jgi:PilZ domain